MSRGPPPPGLTPRSGKEGSQRHLVTLEVSFLNRSFSVSETTCAPDIHWGRG